MRAPRCAWRAFPPAGARFARRAQASRRLLLARRRSLVERLLAVLLRPRTPPAPAVTAAAFQALMRLHELHPPSWVEELPPTAALPVRLVVNPRAWAPVDAGQRAKNSGAAAADPAAAKRGALLACRCSSASQPRALIRALERRAGIEHDKTAFAHVIAAAAAGGGALGLGELTPDAAALCGGARLALMHLAAELSDDAAARLRVYNAVAMSAGAAQRREALFALVHNSHLWRLFYVRPAYLVFQHRDCGLTRCLPPQNGSRSQNTVENFVALLAAGAAPHPTGRGWDAAAMAAAEREAAAAAGEDVDALDQAAADADAEMAPAGAEASQSPRAATQDASQDERATPMPKKRKTVGWAVGCAGGPGFTPPPSSKKQNRRLMAEAELTEARAMQLAAAEGFPTPVDAAAAAARIIGAVRFEAALRARRRIADLTHAHSLRIAPQLLSLTSAAEACAGSGGEGGTARPGKQTSTTNAMGASYRSELDASLVSACASAWKALHAMTRGLPGGVGVGPLASLLAATPTPLDAARLACKAVAHAARDTDVGARKLPELGAHGGPAFLKYAAANCPVRFPLWLPQAPLTIPRHCRAGCGARTAPQRLLPDPRSCGGSGGFHGGPRGAYLRLGVRPYPRMR